MKCCPQGKRQCDPRMSYFHWQVQLMTTHLTVDSQGLSHILMFLWMQHINCLHKNFGIWHWLHLHIIFQNLFRVSQRSYLLMNSCLLVVQKQQSTCVSFRWCQVGNLDWIWTVREHQSMFNPWSIPANRRGAEPLVRNLERLKETPLDVEHGNLEILQARKRQRQQRTHNGIAQQDALNVPQ